MSDREFWIEIRRSLIQLARLPIGGVRRPLLRIVQVIEQYHLPELQEKDGKQADDG